MQQFHPTQPGFTPRLSEHEISAFLSKPASLYSRLLPFLQPAFAAVITVAVLFTAYSYFSQTPAERSVSAAVTDQSSSTPLPAMQVEESTLQATAAPQPLTPENTLVFSSFNISAPILWDTPFTSKDVDSALGDGLVHLAETPKPGESGYTVIFGHSSSLPWVKGQYKDVFAPIVKAQIGQEIILTYNGISYKYVVTRTYEVKPNDLAILSTLSGEQGIRLVTCTPIGTSLRRFVVEASQIAL